MTAGKNLNSLHEISQLCYRSIRNEKKTTTLSYLRRQVSIKRFVNRLEIYFLLPLE